MAIGSDVFGAIGGNVFATELMSINLLVFFSPVIDANSIRIDVGVLSRPLFAFSHLLLSISACTG